MNIDEHMKPFGMYLTEDNARAAIEQLKTQPAFKDWPDGFRICTRTSDKTAWKEGFIIPYDDEEWPRPAM